MKKEIEIANAPTLENLIERNVKSIPARIPVRKPYVNELNLSDEDKQETLEAAQFISEREVRARKNRFAAKDNLNDPTLNEAWEVVTSFIDMAQELYKSNVEKANREQEEVDHLNNDINSLLHSKQIISAIKDLKKATKPVLDRINAVNDTSRLGDHYESDNVSYFAMEAVRRLHSEG
jgi:hypothetical protein